MFIPLAHAAFLLILAFEGGAIAWFLSRKPLLYLGAISLSVYMGHAYFVLRMLNGAKLLEKVTGQALFRRYARRFAGDAPAGRLAAAAGHG